MVEIATMMIPFFYFILAWLMHERQKSKKDNPMHSIFFLFFLCMSLFSMFIPLGTIDLYMNSTAPYNSSDNIIPVVGMGQLYFVLITFLMFIIISIALQWWKMNKEAL